MAGEDIMPIEEVKIEEDLVGDGKKKKNRKKRNMEKYAPLIFEECYVKNKTLSKPANAFELSNDVNL